MDAFDEHVRPVMSRDAQVPNHLLLLHLQQCFKGSALAEDLIDILRNAHIVQLPQVYVIGLQKLQRLLNHPHRPIARPFLRLRREKRFVAPPRHHLAHILLAPAIRAAINRRCVDVIHA